MTRPAELEPCTYWVCVDCYMTHHDPAEARNGHPAPDREPLARIPDTAEVTAGLTWGEHAEDCPNRAAEQWIEDCECERVTFTRSACDGCGSHLAGEREALTVWEVPAHVGHV